MSRSPWLTKASLPTRCLSFLVTEPFRTFTTATAGLPFCPPPPDLSVCSSANAATLPGVQELWRMPRSEPASPL